MLFSMKNTDCRKLSREAQEALRKRVVLAVIEDKMKIIDAVKIFKVSRAAVIKWLKIARTIGFTALNKKQQGRPKKSGKLKGWQASIIVRIITDKCPDQLKFPFSLWTREAIQLLIKKRFQINLSLSSVGRLLKKWGFTPQRPLHRAMERNPKAIAHWIKDQYPKIHKKAKKQKAEIHWGDEMGIRSDHQFGRSYGRKGQTPIIPKSGKRFSCNMISTITNNGSIRFIIYEDSFTIPIFLKFLRKLIYKFPKKIYLIVDNHKVHHAKKVTKWLEKYNDQIELFFLPSYAPELNPDELLNQDTKANALKKERPQNTKQLKKTLRSYLTLCTGYNGPQNLDRLLN